MKSSRTTLEAMRVHGWTSKPRQAIRTCPSARRTPVPGRHGPGVMLYTQSDYYKRRRVRKKQGWYSERDEFEIRSQQRQTTCRYCLLMTRFSYRVHAHRMCMPTMLTVLNLSTCSPIDAHQSLFSPCLTSETVIPPLEIQSRTSTHFNP